ncbi:LADA_0B08350g1_1 [Lachancea dasiensis]|uniref:LADA_0B08350g1_1 n=1 Tax=Lachancea dasiensis TaxID=1072105 RepID=A0A1G4IUF1_9SACH|nr:LADA_0B08350g1_1 [Lachancea dasiensis]
MTAANTHPTSDHQHKGTKRSAREAALSEDQKRQNHVSCEQRRRQAMRETYDTLVEVVPDLTTDHRRSEMQIYARSYNYLVWLYQRNQELRKRVEEQTGSEVPHYLAWEIPTTPRKN